MATSAGTQEVTAGTLVCRVQIEELSERLDYFEHELAQGVIVELVREDRVVAELRAPAPPAPVPDFMARMKALWGDKVFPSGMMTKIISDDRDSR